MEENKSEEVHSNMGLGILGSPKIVFQRAFRWTFCPANHDKVEVWFTKIRVDYKERMLHIEAFDDCYGQVFEWLNDVYLDEASRSATLKHWDGCGRLISSIEFNGLKIEQDCVDYDYSSSDVLTHGLKISFKRLKRRNNLNVQ